MKAIKIHGMAPDNSGEFHAAGTVLAVGDDAKPGVISKPKAEDLVSKHAASPVVEPSGKGSGKAA